MSEKYRNTLEQGRAKFAYDCAIKGSKYPSLVCE